ncbi:TPA: helix-turn-helix domain-containing protein [Pseudomonas aeruginosa]|nr:helix-turn-helix domain-containing protein [Pseudomonas aeruginosa]
MRIQRLTDDAIAEQLGDAMRERRLRKGITQDDLAEQTGVSTPTIQKLEKGKGTLQLLISVLRELNSLDLLATLLAPPRISPLEVVKTGKATRVRATRIPRSTQVAAKPSPPRGTVLIPPKNKPSASAESLKGKVGDESRLLIPRK